MSILVHNPLLFLTVAAAFAAASVIAGRGSLGPLRKARPLGLAAVAWALAGGWEWLVMVGSPEANIRVDLLLIAPVLAIASVWALIGSLR